MKILTLDFSIKGKDWTYRQEEVVHDATMLIYKLEVVI